MLCILLMQKLCLFLRFYFETPGVLTPEVTSKRCVALILDVGLGKHQIPSTSERLARSDRHKATILNPVSDADYSNHDVSIVYSI